MNRSWYAVHTTRNAENLAVRHLDRQGFETFLPLYRKTRRHARRSQTVLVPFFPRYLFVRLNLEADPWRCVNGTVGVRHLVTAGERPLSVPSSVIDGIRDRSPDQILQPNAFVMGSAVRVLDGPLRDLQGLFAGLCDRDRVMVLLDLMGRAVKVRLPLSALESAG